MTATHGAEANRGESIRDLVESLASTHDADYEARAERDYWAAVDRENYARWAADESPATLPNANPPATLGVPADSGGAPGRESEHSASRTTNERLPGI